jgi:hypothetical protein
LDLNGKYKTVADLSFYFFLLVADECLFFICFSSHGHQVRKMNVAVAVVVVGF